MNETQMKFPKFKQLKDHYFILHDSQKKKMRTQIAWQWILQRQFEQTARHASSLPIAAQRPSLHCPPRQVLSHSKMST